MKTLSGLLPVLNPGERTYKNGPVNVQTPVMAIFGASNEYHKERELDAFWDRFVIRFEVKPIQEGENRIAMMKSKTSGRKNQIKSQIDLSEIKEIQKEVENVVVSDEILEALNDMFENLVKNNYVISDRTLEILIPVLRAIAWFEGREEVITEDIADLWPCLWQTPDHIKGIKKMLRSLYNSGIDSFMGMYDQVVILMKSDDDLKERVLNIDKMIKEMEGMKLSQKNQTEARLLIANCKKAFQYLSGQLILKNKVKKL